MDPLVHSQNPSVTHIDMLMKSSRKLIMTNLFHILSRENNYWFQVSQDHGFPLDLRVVPAVPGQIPLNILPETSFNICKCGKREKCTKF